MPKIIFKCHYLRADTSSKKISNTVKYIATREGVEHVQNYIDYIANRPRVEKISTHGLFSFGYKPINLSEVQRELTKDSRPIYMPIISLTREDAIRTGYDNAESWHTLMSKLAPKMAENFKIRLDNYHWYAAFHNEGHHPHIHMIIYSDNPNEGYLNEKGIENIKHELVGNIFNQGLQLIYSGMTEHNKELKNEFREALENIKLESNNKELNDMLMLLNERLRTYKGKKVYGYLNKSTKQLVNNIVDKISENESIDSAYKTWWQLKEEVYHSYSDREWKQPKLSECNEFKSVKNMVIKEVMKMDFSLMLTDNQKQEQEVLTKHLINLFTNIAKVFESKTPEPRIAHNHIDSKRLQKLREKRLALGRKLDDISNDEPSFQMQMY